MDLNIKKSFTLNNKIYYYYSLKEFEKKTNFKIQNLPFSIRILLENLLRNQNENSNNINQIENLIKNSTSSEIFFKPSRILMQDFTGVPAIADLAAMRDKVFKIEIELSIHDERKVAFYNALVKASTQNDEIIYKSYVINDKYGIHPFIDIIDKKRRQEYIDHMSNIYYKTMKSYKN